VYQTDHGQSIILETPACEKHIGHESNCACLIYRRESSSWVSLWETWSGATWISDSEIHG